MSSHRKHKLREAAAGLLSLAILCLGMITAAAHEGLHDRDDAESEPSSGSRTWTLAESQAHWHGTFLLARDGLATFHRDDGQVISISIDQLTEGDRHWIEKRLLEIERLNRLALTLAPTPSRNFSDPPGTSTAKDEPAIHQHFLPFQKSLGLRWDDRFYYVESNGMPEHPMMIGIKAWQQQVPLPQDYRGSNAWQIPLQPVPAKEPKSAKTSFFRGAIALAVNGVPIFNPIKNDGRTDTFLAGELDRWGGHCGRGDDYHYHLPPVHLEEVVGVGKPVAYALDGYPIYGYQDESSPDFAPLDELNGHKDADGGYHYHATKTYPYLNGGFYGEVVERDGQVDPQPRAYSPRPALPPLRGAEITDFFRREDGRHVKVTYRLRGEIRSVSYTQQDDGSLTFAFDNGEDGTEQESYPNRQPARRPGRGGPPRESDGSRQGPPPQTSNEPNRRAAPDPSRIEQASRQPGRGAETANEPRRPWMTVHAAEMDTDSDGVLSIQELESEIKQAFAGYDSDQNGQVSFEDLASGRSVRSALGGFIRQHREEIDRDKDLELTEGEVRTTVMRMFEKADPDRDGKIVIEQADDSIVPLDPNRSTATLPRGDTEERSIAERSIPSSGQISKPNFIIILMDDMGWRDVGFAGNTFVETPHLDRLAKQGIRFTQAYASAPNCAPTRACLLSGQYTPRHRVFTVIDPRHDPGQPHHRILSTRSEESLDGAVVTIAELLKSEGYATGCFGMWNLGRGRSGPTTPTGQGFDVYRKPQDLGFEQNAYRSADGRYETDVLFEQGIQFIDEHAREPFFLYLPTHAIHAPFDPKPELIEKYRAKAQRLSVDDADPEYAAMIDAVDQNVGRLLKFLEERELDENTLIVFTSDNGGTPRYVAPLNGSKGALYEGGIRVPCVMWGKGIANPGRDCHEPILSMDFYPTLAGLAGAELPAAQPIDGKSLEPVLQQSGSLGREAVFWHFPCYVGRGEPSSAVRAGDWKLIQKFSDQTVELYNLREDPGETRNLADSNSQKTQSMLEILHRWQISVKAPLPSEPNPAFDPSTVRTSPRRANRPSR